MLHIGFLSIFLNQLNSTIHKTASHRFIHFALHSLKTHLPESSTLNSLQICALKNQEDVSHGLHLHAKVNPEVLEELEEIYCVLKFAGFFTNLVKAHFNKLLDLVFDSFAE